LLKEQPADASPFAAARLFGAVLPSLLQRLQRALQGADSKQPSLVCNDPVDALADAAARAFPEAASASAFQALERTLFDCAESVLSPSGKVQASSPADTVRVCPGGLGNRDVDALLLLYLLFASEWQREHTGAWPIAEAANAPSVSDALALDLWTRLSMLRRLRTLGRPVPEAVLAIPASVSAVVGTDTGCIIAPPFTTTAAATAPAGAVHADRSDPHEAYVARLRPALARTVSGYDEWARAQAPRGGGGPDKDPVGAQQRQGSLPFAAMYAQQIAALRKQGVAVFLPPEAGSQLADAPAWTDLAGFEHIKKQVEDNILLPMESPEAYAAMAKQTRVRPEENRFGCFLFTGRPGTGKTTCARILAETCGRPLVVLSFEAIGSKWYSSTEKHLEQVLQAVSQMEGAVLFVDEAETLFPSRAAHTADAKARKLDEKILSQFLRFLEGFSGSARNVTILATNKANALDPALLSRCAANIRFPAPSRAQRKEIFALYAKHLPPEALQTLSEGSEGMTGRDIKRICEVVERRHVGELLRARPKQSDPGGPKSPALPPLTTYLQALLDRRRRLVGIGSGDSETDKDFDQWGTVDGVSDDEEDFNGDEEAKKAARRKKFYEHGSGTARSIET
jgi:hypothetical protein